jgi:hypothetical protein
MKDFVTYCKDYIKDNIEALEDSDVYGSELALSICEDDNANGTMTYSTKEAEQYIKEWWDDCTEFYEYAVFNFGDDYATKNLNVFADSEKFMFMMVFEGIGFLLSRVSIIDENWNDEFTLDRDTIDTILKEINEIHSIEW